MTDDLRYDAYRLHVAGHLSVEEYEVVLQRIAAAPTVAGIPPAAVAASVPTPTAAPHEVPSVGAAPAEVPQVGPASVVPPAVPTAVPPAGAVSSGSPAAGQWWPVFAIVGSTLAVGVAAAVLVVTS